MLQNAGVTRRKLRARTLALFLVLEVIVTIALGTSLLALPYFQKSIEVEPISLRNVVENPDDYLGERNVTLTLTRIEPREDPYHRLTEKYYLAYVRDEEGYERPFVISEEDEDRYRKSVGFEAIFELKGSIGPQLIHPPDKLMTNILVSVQADPYSREYYIISIRLREPADDRPSQLIILTYLAVVFLGATALTLAVFLANRRLRRLSQPQILRTTVRCPSYFYML
mgnify:CR=1 FL=1